MRRAFPFSRCLFVALLALVAGSLLAEEGVLEAAPTQDTQAAATAPSASRPNVIVMICDDLGAMDLTCYGSKYHKTPHLDALAAQGVRFTQAYAACPVCSPTRLSILTGKYPARLNLTDWLPGRGDLPGQLLKRPVIRQELPLAEITLAERFREAGYDTAHIGKWHLGGEGFGPSEQGFAINIAGDHTGTPLSYFAPFIKNGRAMPGLDQAPPRQYLTDRLTDEAIRFVTAPREKPFFLYFPHYAPHTPLQAPEELVAEFATTAPFSGQQNNPVYAAMLKAIDTGLGRLVKALTDAGQFDNTIILFSSDNGGLVTHEGAIKGTPATSNAPLREGKGWLYEGGVRVPLIVKAPTAKPGTTNETPVISCDFTATLCELCRLPAPQQVDGLSFASLLDGSKPLPARPLFWHYPHYANQGSRPGGMVRDGALKLIEFYETGRRELYDLAKDPRETRNLAADRPADVERLAAVLADWRTSVNAQMPTPNPGYRPNPPDAKGQIEIHARSAFVHGQQLRYEPMPHKTTLGFWTRTDDWAEFQFTIVTPGTFTVEGLIGCGKGSGGSSVEFTVGTQTLTLTVPETGGFQAFQPLSLGEFTFSEPGRYTLSVKAKSKPGPAVMDLRQITLTPRKS